MKLLIVEDNHRLAKDMQQFLTENGFVVAHVATLHAAVEKVNVYEYDLVIIDIGLPDGSGLELIPEIKQNGQNTGILIVTAKDGVEEKVEGLDLGADDYITKPFHKAELNARIRSILRRKKFDGSNVLRMNEIAVDVMASQAYVNETPLHLTKKEYDLLVYFLYNQNRLMTKESIAEHLWGDHIDQADRFDFIYNHIKNLRKKILKAGGRNYIHSMYGMGYKYTASKTGVIAS